MNELHIPTLSFDNRGHLVPYEIIELTLPQFEAFFVDGLEDLKKGFVKDLLAVLVQSNLSVSDLEPFLQNATSYLQKFDRLQQHLPGDLKKNLAEVEQMLTVRDIEMPVLQS